MPYILTEDGTLKKDDRNYLSRASSKDDLFAALCLQVVRSEAAEARAAQLEGERDAAWRELRELQSHHTSIVLALYEIDEEVFGPLTVKEGIAELKQQRDTARADIVRYQDERVTLLGRIEALIAENKTTNDAQCEVDRLNRFLQVIVNMGDKDRHVAFDGERWREMRHCANQALMTKNEEYEP